MSAKTIRNIREPLKKPRPLKPSASTDQMKIIIQESKDAVPQKSRADILADLETLHISISNCNFDDITIADISQMCSILKNRGEELDSFHKEALDRYFCTLRNASREDKLDVISRLKLLEVIEMRARHWKMNENLSNYFSMKFLDLEHGLDRLNISDTITSSGSHSPQNLNLNAGSGVSLSPGEVLKSSGKFLKPTKIAGKNYFKDEIVIRNSDSGKVNPGARDRLVQITGPHEDAIGHAKLLVEDTIRRNASPVRENVASSLVNEKEHCDYTSLYSSMDNQSFLKKQLMHSHSMGDASLKEFSVSVQVGQDVITLMGDKPELLKTAKLVLTEYFAGQKELLEKKHDFMSSNSHNTQRFDLQKQTSLKDNVPKSLSSVWLDQNYRKASISSFSSSDEDVIRDESKNSIEVMNCSTGLKKSVALTKSLYIQ